MQALHAARDAGTWALDAVAAEHSPDDPEQAAAVHTYLRENLRFDLDEDGRAGLARYFAAAAEIGIIPEAAPLRFLDG